MTSLTWYFRCVQPTITTALIWGYALLNDDGPTALNVHNITLNVHIIALNVRTVALNILQNDDGPTTPYKPYSVEPTLAKPTQLHSEKAHPADGSEEQSPILTASIVAPPSADA
eukprot:1185072-Prorocentrum_minimum.AAC.6